MQRRTGRTIEHPGRYEIRRGIHVVPLSDLGEKGLRQDVSGDELHVALTQGNSLHLRFPSGWLEKSPLTLIDLEQEARYLKAADVSLTFSSRF